MGYGAPFQDVWIKIKWPEKAESDSYLIFAMVLLGSQIK